MGFDLKWVDGRTIDNTYQQILKHSIYYGKKVLKNIKRVNTIIRTKNTRRINTIVTNDQVIFNNEKLNCNFKYLVVEINRNCFENMQNFWDLISVWNDSASY